MDAVARLITFPLQFIYETLFSALRLAWSWIRRRSDIQQGPEETDRPLISSSSSSSSAAAAAARLDRSEITMNRRLRQEQDEEYMESLRADQEKDRRKQEEKQKRETEERKRKQREMEESEQKERLLQLKMDLVDKIPAEPSAEDPDVIRVAIKLPNGTRLNRRYHRTDYLKYLYYFVFCHEESPLQFQITTNFPRQKLPGSPPTIDNIECNGENPSSNSKPETFESVGLGKSAVLFVHDLEA